MEIAIINQDKIIFIDSTSIYKNIYYNRDNYEKIYKK